MSQLLFSRVCLFSSASLLCVFAAVACDSAPRILEEGDGSNRGEAGAGNGSGGDFGLGNLGSGGKGSGGNGGDGSGGGGPVCETASEEAELAPIFLAFAFDVSGSMGQLDRPNWWHDPNAKWVPVREATQAFFQDDSSTGISASMAFFPAASNSCSADSYSAPDVAMQALPADAFATAFDGYESIVGSPLAGGAWRGGTPTLAAFNGTSEYLVAFRAANPDARFAVVLVTDGYPQGCTGANAISTVANAVGGLYDDGDGVRTYVIGLENPQTPPSALPAGWSDWGNSCPFGGPGGSEPCDAPDTLADLNAIASAGGTTEAFLIDTGNPEATKTAFRSAIDAIRAEAISCELGIPAHPDGGSFDPDKIDVSYTLGSTTERFDYDAECLVEGAWHYDDEENPTLIELCPTTCDFIQSSPGAQLNVDFLCEDRPVVPR